MKRVGLFLVLFVAMISLIGCETKETIVDVSTEPQDKIQECFDTYEELDAWFTKDENGIAPVIEEMSLHGEQYEEFVSNVLVGKWGLLKPYWGDERMPLHTKDGFVQIDVGCMDGGRPWLWYFCEMQGVEWSICLKYLTEEEIDRLKTSSIDEVLITEAIFRGRHAEGKNRATFSVKRLIIKQSEG